jgi:hypothetical protein
MLRSVYRHSAETCLEGSTVLLGARSWLNLDVRRDTLSCVSFLVALTRDIDELLLVNYSA